MLSLITALNSNLIIYCNRMLFTERDKQKVSGESFWQSPLTVYSHSVCLGGGGNKSSLIIRPSLKQNNTCKQDACRRPLWRRVGCDIWKRIWWELWLQWQGFQILPDVYIKNWQKKNHVSIASLRSDDITDWRIKKALQEETVGPKELRHTATLQTWFVAAGYGGYSVATCSTHITVSRLTLVFSSKLRCA